MKTSRWISWSVVFASQGPVIFRKGPLPSILQLLLKRALQQDIYGCLMILTWREYPFCSMGYVDGTKCSILCFKKSYWHLSSPSWTNRILLPGFQRKKRRFNSVDYRAPEPSRDLFVVDKCHEEGCIRLIRMDCLIISMSLLTQERAED